VRNKLDKTKRVQTERVPDRQLAPPFLLFGLILLMLEWILSHGWLRRLP
jgi:hypothetical protein